jgi:hypothetical protein
MVKYTIFVRGVLHENETPLHRSQAQFTIQCNTLTEEEDSIDFIKNNTSIFSMKMDTEDLFLHQGISTTQQYRNFWWFIGERDIKDKHYTKTWSGGNATKCRAAFRDL